MDRTWMKVRTVSGKELLGYTIKKTKDEAPGTASVDVSDDAMKLELHAPVMIWVDAEKKVHMIPETDANNLKDAVVIINIQAVEAYMVVPDTSDLVRAISAQISGIVLPPTGNTITNINQVKK